MITASGIGSGLDIEGLVTQLVAAERAPTETRLLRQSALLSTELSAFGLLKSSLADLQDSFAALNSLTTFGQRTSESSNPDVLEVASSGSPVNGVYDVSVNQLAKAHSLASASFASPGDVVGTGTLTFRFGTTDYTAPDPGPESYNGFSVNPEQAVASIDIDAGNNSLEGIRDAINDAEIGVKAAIVNDGSGYRLLISSGQTGAENSLEISVTGSGDGNDLDANGLSALAFNSAATNLEQTVAAQDALFSVNGLTIASPGNNADNVIDGIDISLKGLTETGTVTVTVQEDQASVTEAISSFVDGYNSFIEAANGLTAYDPATGSAGALQGDFSVRSIVGQVRQLLSNAVDGVDSSFASLSQIGITTQSDGTLAIDEARLDSVVADRFDEIVSLFSAVGLPSDPSIEFVAANESTAVSSFAIDISQVATRGQLQGAAAGFPLTIDENNDDLSVMVDGILSAGLAITRGSYTSGSELAAEIQSSINSDQALRDAGVAVDVAYNAGRLEITSRRYGSASMVEITAVDLNTAAQLGLGVGAGVAGVDVAGTIGGVAALGTGQLLRGATGSDSEGLQLRIDGGATGPRGVVDFTRGITEQLDRLLVSFLDSDGILDARTDGLQDRADSIEEQREALDLRMASLEARYRARFNALDGLLAQLQSTSTFLTQQLASLPEAGSLLNNN